MPGFFPCVGRCCPSRSRVDLRNLGRSLILLPVVGNAAEHVTALVVARKNKLDLSLAVAVGSSLQIALFVIPVLVLLAWCIGQPLDLEFDSFETLLVFLTVCVVNWGASSAFPRSNALVLTPFLPLPASHAAIADARTNWMEGAGLMFVYVIIATCVWFCTFHSLFVRRPSLERTRAKSLSRRSRLGSLLPCLSNRPSLVLTSSPASRTTCPNAVPLFVHPQDSPPLCSPPEIDVTHHEQCLKTIPGLYVRAAIPPRLR